MGLRNVPVTPPFRKIALGTWDRPGDPQIYGTLEIDLTNAYAWRDSLPEDAPKVTVTHMVARAMAMDPVVIFYDEPSAGLDPVVAAEIDVLIRKMQSTFNLTSIVVTHEMASVDVIADTVCMLHEGKVVAMGPPGEVKASKHPYVRQFFERRPDTYEGDGASFLRSLTENE